MEWYTDVTEIFQIVLFLILSKTDNFLQLFEKKYNFIYTGLKYMRKYMNTQK